MRIIVGMTGASGAIFGVDFLRRCPGEKYLILTRWGRYVLKEETGLTEHHLAEHVKKSFSDEDLAAPFSSGSNPFDALVILPCSISTMAKIACGLGDTLLTRTAQVALKERRRLIIGLRETPLSTIALEQAHRLSLAGAIVMPISPPFYHRPQTIEEMVEQFNGKVLSLLGFETALAWKPEALE
ncbi:MAG: UbiX family flavin prenyltransferase [Candidatus Omnitrophica bacterium]|nr:UbiX family flavin prenyltransferase [Candidatus Omnitrophota bacterium]MBI2496009.1 UbiX family flavin prenyltransferase [Candidatus Omnitrophota bacterium]MBI3020458.1 UbiX family flavin prenyltransferase [Candidatus Omnitrophota bacterium]MBI3083920.1 UbiX family flavin prenyltransferase [Candidatus Omnitrophota bacterium]